MASSGRYQRLRSIASGGMATVYLGRASRPGGFERLVAIKVMHPHLAADPEFVRMFLDEARLAASIRHPNVLSVLDVEATENDVSLVMEYIDGPSLGQLLKSYGGAKLPIESALRIMIDALTGLHAAHDLAGPGGVPLNIVHRDVSPHNILIGNDGVVRIADFGVAYAQMRLATTQSGQMKGKLGYMALEQLRGQAVDRRSDIYSAGVVLWELLAGERLFTGDTDGALAVSAAAGPVQSPHDIDDKVPGPIDDVCMRALCKSPEDRWPTAAAFAEALEDAATAADIRVARTRDLAQMIQHVEEDGPTRLRPKAAAEWMQRVGIAGRNQLPAERPMAPPPPPMEEGASAYTKPTIQDPPRPEQAPTDRPHSTIRDTLTTDPPNSEKSDELPTISAVRSIDPDRESFPPQSEDDSEDDDDYEDAATMPLSAQHLHPAEAPPRKLGLGHTVRMEPQDLDPRLAKLGDAAKAQPVSYPTEELPGRMAAARANYQAQPQGGPGRAMTYPTADAASYTAQPANLSGQYTAAQPASLSGQYSAAQPANLSGQYSAAQPASISGQYPGPQSHLEYAPKSYNTIQPANLSGHYPAAQPAHGTGNHPAIQAAHSTGNHPAQQAPITGRHPAHPAPITGRHPAQPGNASGNYPSQMGHDQARSVSYPTGPSGGLNLATSIRFDRPRTSRMPAIAGIAVALALVAVVVWFIMTTATQSPG